MPKKGSKVAGKSARSVGSEGETAARRDASPQDRGPLWFCLILFVGLIFVVGYFGFVKTGA